jgi:hypothetical protein
MVHLDYDQLGAPGEGTLPDYWHAAAPAPADGSFYAEHVPKQGLHQSFAGLDLRCTGIRYDPVIVDVLRALYCGT